MEFPIHTVETAPEAARDTLAVDAAFAPVEWKMAS